jgi:hypothetical protein
MGIACWLKGMNVSNEACAYKFLGVSESSHFDTICKAQLQNPSIRKRSYDYSLLIQFEQFKFLGSTIEASGELSQMKPVGGKQGFIRLNMAVRKCVQMKNIVSKQAVG